MGLSESRIRRIIREEITSTLSEAVRNTHGYRVNGLDDVIWSGAKAEIPRERNPFVGSSAAFNDWFNDGDPTKGFMMTMGRGSPDERRRWMNQEIMIKEGEFVIIPKLWGEYPMVGEVMTIRNIPADSVRGSSSSDSIPLVDIRFEEAGRPSRWLRGVGLAFLRRVAGKRSRDDAWEEANRAMDQHRAGAPEPRRSREPVSDLPREPERGRDEERRTIRRVGGVPTPPERRPMSMSADDIRRDLGIKRR
jgi:hypothetical protein